MRDYNQTITYIIINNIIAVDYSCELHLQIRIPLPTKIESAKDTTFGVLCLARKALMKVKQMEELSTLLLHSLQNMRSLKVNFKLLWCN